MTSVMEAHLDYLLAAKAGTKESSERASSFGKKARKESRKSNDYDYNSLGGYLPNPKGNSPLDDYTDEILDKSYDPYGYGHGGGAHTTVIHHDNGGYPPLGDYHAVDKEYTECCEVVVDPLTFYSLLAAIVGAAAFLRVLITMTLGRKRRRRSQTVNAVSDFMDVFNAGRRVVVAFPKSLAENIKWLIGYLANLRKILNMLLLLHFCLP